MRHLRRGTGVLAAIGALTGASVLVTLPPAGPAGGALSQDRVSIAAPSPSAGKVVLAGGPSAFPEATTVLSASSGGVVFAALPVNGAGQLAASPSFWAVALSASGSPTGTTTGTTTTSTTTPSTTTTTTAGTTTSAGATTTTTSSTTTTSTTTTSTTTTSTTVPIAAATPIHLLVPTPGTTIVSPGSSISVSGSEVSVLEKVLGRPAFKVWSYDLATGVARLRALGAGETFESAAPKGFLETSRSKGLSTLAELDASTGKALVLGTISGTGPSFLAGPSAVVATETDARTTLDSTVEYVDYARPSRWHVLADSPGRWRCTSITEVAVGCEQSVGGGNGTALENFSLRGAASVAAHVGGSPVNVRALVTSSATAWSYCGTSGCELTRLDDAGGPAASISIPTGQTAATGPEVIWGAPPGSAAGGGLFALTNGAASPATLASSPLSPLDAAAISVAAGSVTYVDNDSAGLSVIRQSLSESPSHLLHISPPIRIGSPGLVTPGASSPGVSLVDGGSVVVYSVDNAAGAPSPVGLEAVGPSGGAGHLVTSSVDAAKAEEGEPVTIDDGWVEWTWKGTCYLGRPATGTLVRWPARGVVACAVGEGRLAWLSSRGGVYEVSLSESGPAPLSSAKTVVPRLSSGRSLLAGSARLLLGGGYAAWDYRVSPGRSQRQAVAGYVSLVRRSPPVAFSGGIEIDGITGTWLATTKGTAGYPTLRGIVSRRAVRLATYGRSLSIGGGLAGWIGPDGRPRVALLPAA